MAEIIDENTDELERMHQKLRDNFSGRIVRKDLTKKIKEGANVPVYVLEYLLGMYCSSQDEDEIEAGVENVKKILADNFVRPDEAQKVLSVLRQRGSLGIKAIPISEEYPTQFDCLLCGGIWCIVQLDYEYIEEDKWNGTPILR